VRDLCRDSDESDALRDAIRSQAAPDSWGQVGGPGSIQFAKPGTMVGTPGMAIDLWGESPLYENEALNSKCKRFPPFERPRRWKSPGFRSCPGGSNLNP
ncbi:MAG: hypothetical protein ACQESR_28535, partial [Planctomycetota bacterium]